MQINNIKTEIENSINTPYEEILSLNDILEDIHNIELQEEISHTWKNAIRANASNELLTAACKIVTLTAGAKKLTDAFLAILATLPGGAFMYDYNIQMPQNAMLGWNEYEILLTLLENIHTERDVRIALRIILDGIEEI